jgi:hypothetical protein
MVLYNLPELVILTEIRSNIEMASHCFRASFPIKTYSFVYGKAQHGHGIAVIFPTTTKSTLLKPHLIQRVRKKPIKMILK